LEKAKLIFRKVNKKLATVAQSALYQHAATVSADNMFDDGQAQSSAANVPPTVVIHPVKAFG
jgi:hypothetical protein